MKTSELTGYALNGEVHKLAYPDEPVKWGCTAPPYASDWLFGGPIIEREGIDVLKDGAGWTALKTATVHHGHIRMHGPTPLIAAMRCYVASKLGEEIELPEELI